VIVGTAFSVMAALLALHGLASPGILVEFNGLVSFTGGATLPLGGAVLALTALPALRRPRNVKRLLVLQVSLLVAVAIVGTVGMLVPSVVPSVPEPASAAALAALGVGLFFYGFLGLRAVNTYLLTRRRADLLVVFGLAFLGAALGAALLLDFQDLGWWLGHGFELVGILLVGIPVAADLYRGAPSRTLTGGPRAGELVSAEEAFLGARVRALMVRLAEKDEYTEEHTRRVALRAVQVGEELGLAPSRLRTLATGGLLHDIGKLSVPDAILKKPGSLDEAEFAVIQRHPEWGNRLLGELGGFSEAVRRLVLDHHERLDGKGYPHGRLGAELDLETRILAVCDVYDALLSVRVYRPAWSHERAMALLREETSTAFDPGCVAALERVLSRETALSLGVAV
jgi:HD-GYP domain-containing protein (c-di-GMP phosphodiesterase class II)